MKELEFKIYSILDQHLLAGGTGWIDGQGIASKEIAKEVKDIAIEFLDYVKQQQTFMQIDRTDDVMFDDFIKQRYDS